ncbi:MaoC family dehydratase [Mycobacterium syngnathidarum]
MWRRHVLSRELSPAEWPVVRRAVPFEEHVVGRRFDHHWGRTIMAGEATAFSTQMLAFHPPYFNVEAARKLGHNALLVHPMLVFTTVFGLSVEDLSESGGAFLGAEGVEFVEPVHPGDTLYASSVVLHARHSDSRPGKGVVTWETTGRDHTGREVIRFRRTNLISKGHPEGSITAPEGYAEDFTVGQRMRHARSRTISDIDLNGLTLSVMNSAAGHFSEAEMAGTEYGSRINFGGLTLSLVLGLATQDTTPQLVREVELTSITFPCPVRRGDTIFAATEVVDVAPADMQTSKVRFRHHGLNQHGKTVCVAERTVILRNRD